MIEKKLERLDAFDNELKGHHELLGKLLERLDETTGHVASLEALTADLEVRIHTLAGRYDQRFGQERQTCRRCGRLTGPEGKCQYGCSS